MTPTEQFIADARKLLVEQRMKHPVLNLEVTIDKNTPEKQALSRALGMIEVMLPCVKFYSTLFDKGDELNKVALETLEEIEQIAGRG